MVNVLVNNVDKLLQDDLDVVDSSTTEVQGKENDFEGSEQSATQVKMTHEIEELRKQVKCLEKELKQLKTKPKFDIDEHNDSCSVEYPVVPCLDSRKNHVLYSFMMAD